VAVLLKEEYVKLVVNDQGGTKVANEKKGKVLNSFPSHKGMVKEGGRLNGIAGRGGKAEDPGKGGRSRLREKQTREDEIDIPRRVKNRTGSEKKEKDGEPAPGMGSLAARRV